MSAVNPNPPGSSVRASRPDFVVLLLLAASLSLNVYLGWKLRQGTAAPISARLAAGMKLDPVTVTDADGKPLTLSYDGNKPTVLYVMSPSCIWCRRNQANINMLTASKANDYRFVGLSVVHPG